MKANEVEYEVYRLSNDFYIDYNNATCPEILEKNTRAYNCLVLKTKEDYFVCIPYRTEIRHGNAYKFKTSKRSRIHNSGLDYSKIVIIKDNKYIGNATVVDKDEYKETRNNITRIANEANEYIDEYIAYQNGVSKLSKEELRRRYEYTSLAYFHEELGL